MYHNPRQCRIHVLQNKTLANRPIARHWRIPLSAEFFISGGIRSERSLLQTFVYLSTEDRIHTQRKNAMADSCVKNVLGVMFVLHYFKCVENIEQNLLQCIKKKSFFWGEHFCVVEVCPPAGLGTRQDVSFNISEREGGIYPAGLCRSNFVSGSQTFSA